MIQMTDSDGNVYSAEPLGRGFWYIGWAEGGMRYFGTATNVKKEIRSVMKMMMERVAA